MPSSTTSPERDEIGAAVAITLAGEPVVDLWAGHADPARTRPWERDTIVHVYSTTKGVTALAAHHLASQGKLDLDAPVAEIWARVRPGRQGRGAGALAALPPRGPHGRARVVAARDALRLGWDVPGTCGGDALVRTRRRLRLSPGDVRLAGRPR